MANTFNLLNTRPQPFNDQLTEQLHNKLGINVLQLPAIEIEPMACQLQGDVDGLIFTSANAVICSQEALTSYKNNVLTIAIGAKTKATLEDLGWQNVQVPERANSEAILAMSKLDLINNENIVIVTGENGRDLLTQQLLKKQAKPKTLICYRRIMPVSIESSIIREIECENIAIVLITSVACYENLSHILGNIMDKLEKSSNWLVFSDRIKQYLMSTIANERIHVCKPSDESVLAAVKMLYKDFSNE